MLEVWVAFAVLAPAQSAEVPFKIADDAMIVEAHVNGRRASLMFDTGFSGSVVMNDQLDIGKPSGEMRLRDFVGEFSARTVELKSFRIGGVDVDTKGMAVVQQPMAHMSFSYNTHTDGVLGMEVFRDRVLELDFERSRMILHPRSYDVSGRQFDNKRTFLSRMLPMGMDSILLDVFTAGGQRLVLALDTGNAFFATTHKDVLERVGLWKPGAEPKFTGNSFVASGPVRSWYWHMTDVTISGVRVPSSVWSIIDLPSASSEHDGTVGFGFLRNFKVVIDQERRVVWMENWTGKVGNDLIGSVGLSGGYDPDKGKVVVYQVTPGGPAAKAGVRRHDELLDIDGRDMRKETFRTIQRLLEGRVGQPVKIAVSRSGQLMRFELAREPLVNGLPSETD